MEKDTSKANIARLKEFQTGGREKLLGIKFPQKPA